MKKKKSKEEQQQVKERKEFHFHNVILKAKKNLKDYVFIILFNEHTSRVKRLKRNRF